VRPGSAEPLVTPTAGAEAAAPAGPALAVVVPVRDEAGNIAPLVEEIAAALAGRLAFEIVYVDDGSRDATAAELTAARDRHANLRVVRHPESRGQSAAILSGVEAARAAWIATLDGDGQNDPADIPRLLDTLAAAGEEAKVELVSGVRRRRRDTLVKRLASSVANRVRAWVLKDETPDTGCGLKLFRRETYLALPRFDHMHRFIPALIRSHGGKIRLVDVNHRPRAAGHSKYGVMDRLWTGIVDLLGVMWLQRRARRPEVEPEE